MHRKTAFCALLLAALGLGPGLAHVLELPVKMHYSPELYAAVTSTLYAGFGIAGSVLQLSALVLAVGWCIAERASAGVRLLRAGAALLAASLIAWGALVQPVNAAWADVVREHPGTMAASYAGLRPRWEYGHVVAFAFWLAGFAALQAGALRARHGSVST